MKKSILTLFAVMFITSANADTKSITPQEFAQSISEVPSKVSSAVKKRVGENKGVSKEILGRDQKEMALEQNI